MVNDASRSIIDNSRVTLQIVIHIMMIIYVFSTGNGSTVVEDSCHNLKINGSNPAEEKVENHGVNLTTSLVCLFSLTFLITLRGFQTKVQIELNFETENNF